MLVCDKFAAFDGAERRRGGGTAVDDGHGQTAESFAQEDLVNTAIDPIQTCQHRSIACTSLVARVTTHRIPSVPSFSLVNRRLHAVHCLLLTPAFIVYLRL